ncbi:DUF2460 domain-containing protein [Mesorhizobium sp. CAU 1741]|uniref:DUF2460 domain-containing protein n=1 Tax=Mesorhizobium sp. CAU 1741 TaxID=3140366 RepID=UPI00325AE781
MDAFHEIRFPVDVSFGATGGPERRNEIVSLTSGREHRNLRFARSRRHFDAGTGVRSLSDLYEIIAFFEARRGSFHGFRFRDPFDMKSCPPDQQVQAADQHIGTGDGVRAEFQLVKRYGETEDAYDRAIRKPVAGTVRIAVAGTELDSPADFSVDTATGIVTFEPGSIPVAGQEITAGFEFDVPARFDAERIAISLSAFNAGQIPSIPIVEIEP